jgi:hypothetical protein
MSVLLIKSFSKKKKDLSSSYLISRSLGFRLRFQAVSTKFQQASTS